MKGKFVVAVFAVALLAGCATMGKWPSYYQLDPPVIRASASDETLSIRIVSEDDYSAHAEIENQSERPVTILWDKSSYSYPDGDSSRIVTGETRRVDVNRSQPPLSISAGNLTRETLIAAKAVKDEQIASWMEVGGEFLVAYEQAESSHFLSVPIDSVDKTEGDEILGYVTVEQTRWHPLFVGFPERIRSSLREEVRAKVDAQYGDNARMVNERFDSEWHPLSLLIGFSMYGWVENASLTVTILNPLSGS